MPSNPFSHHLRLKTPCDNCPFRLDGAVDLAPGRLEGIIRTLLDDDRSTFQCHKTVHSTRGGEWADDGRYTPSGHEAMCAGAAALLMKRGRPTLTMRLAFAWGLVRPDCWEPVADQIIE